MEINFKIAKFIKNGDLFEKDGYYEFRITYLKGIKAHHLRIVVDGFLTKQTVNLLDYKSGYKNRILLAIKEYLTNDKEIKNKVTKKITISYLENFYSKKIIHTIKTYLFDIKKEESRDKLTELDLIKFLK